IDPEFDFRWPAGEGPLPGAGDIYCIRWTGRIRPLRSGTHTFRTRNDDGVRVRVGGTLVVDDWKARLVVADNRGSIDLEAGRLYDVVVEYSNGGDLGLLRVTWSGPGEPERLVAGE
ncbi:MAG TPA: PA14 domain-containing protein, partial [Planctomycetota bacterium]|nr:PA14 domain-containing protein [Planctomycetota bacterium]